MHSLRFIHDEFLALNSFPLDFMVLVVTWVYSVYVCRCIYVLAIYSINCIHSSAIEINFLRVCACVCLFRCIPFLLSITLPFSPHHQQLYLCSSTSETYAQCKRLAKNHVANINYFGQRNIHALSFCGCTWFSRGKLINVMCLYIPSSTNRNYKRSDSIWMKNLKNMARLCH